MTQPRSNLRTVIPRRVGVQVNPAEVQVEVFTEVLEIPPDQVSLREGVRERVAAQTVILPLGLVVEVSAASVTEVLGVNTGVVSWIRILSTVGNVLGCSNR